MSDEEIKIAIAKACGVKPVETRWEFYYAIGLGRPINSRGYASYDDAKRAADNVAFSISAETTQPTPYEQPTKLSDYPNDLNAMHEAEDGLKRPQAERFYEMLHTIVAGHRVFRDSTSARFSVAHATARQRAEAFLRTLNLWKD